VVGPLGAAVGPGGGRGVVRPLVAVGLSGGGAAVGRHRAAVGPLASLWNGNPRGGHL
jgi:hypothetical protein